MMPPPTARSSTASAGPATARKTPSLVGRSRRFRQSSTARRSPQSASTMGATASSTSPRNPTSSARVTVVRPVPILELRGPLQDHQSQRVGQRKRRLPDVWRHGLARPKSVDVDRPERRTQTGFRQPHWDRNLKHARRGEQQRLRAGRQQQRPERRHRQPRSAPQQQRSHDQREAHPDVGAQQLGHERRIGANRRRQQRDQQVNPIVIRHGHAGIPRQLRRVRTSGAHRGDEPVMDVRVGIREQLTAGQRHPQQRQNRHRESRRHAGLHPDALAPAPNNPGA